MCEHWFYKKKSTQRTEWERRKLVLNFIIVWMLFPMSMTFLVIVVVLCVDYNIFFVSRSVARILVYSKKKLSHIQLFDGERLNRNAFWMTNVREWIFNFICGQFQNRNIIWHFIYSIWIGNVFLFLFVCYIWFISSNNPVKSSVYSFILNDRSCSINHIIWVLRNFFFLNFLQFKC